MLFWLFHCRPILVDYISTCQITTQLWLFKDFLEWSLASQAISYRTPVFFFNLISHFSHSLYWINKAAVDPRKYYSFYFLWCVCYTAFLGMPSLSTLSPYLHEKVPQVHFNSFDTLNKYWGPALLGVQTIIFPLDLCFSVFYQMDHFLLHIIIKWWMFLTSFARLQILEGQVCFIAVLCSSLYIRLCSLSCLTVLLLSSHSNSSKTLDSMPTSCASKLLSSHCILLALVNCMLARSYVGFQDYFMAGNLVFIVII